SRRRHTRWPRDWSSDVCSSDLLGAKVRHIASDTEAVIVEHEHGIFSDVPFVRALLSFWRRKIPVVLSMHELEPEKFHHFRMISRSEERRVGKECRYRWSPTP